MGERLAELAALLGLSRPGDLPGVKPTGFDGTTDEIAARIATADEPLATALLEEAQSHFDTAHDRAESAERRATTLQGAVAIAASLMFAGAALLLDSSKVRDTSWRVAFGVGLLLVITCLIMAGYRAVTATSRLYRWVFPWAEGIYDHARLDATQVHVQRAADLLKSYGNNQAVATRKLEALRNAAIWFTRALVLIVVLAALLVAYAAVGQTAPPSPAKTPDTVTGPTGPRGPTGARGRAGRRGPPGRSVRDDP
jgi:hypothetical protein